jgi:outer membrane protein TolC
MATPLPRPAAALVLILSSCLSVPDPMPPRELPRLTAAGPVEDGLSIALGSGVAEPMYQELLAIDLATAVQVALARNLDVEAARARVQAAHGGVAAARGRFLPSFSPALLYETVDGSVRATEGNLVDVRFQTTQAWLVAAWIVNPGAVHHDLVAAKKRQSSALHDEQAVRMETLQRAAVGYYDLVLAQLAVEATRQSVAEAEELLRITEVRVKTGTGLAADEMRVRAELARRRQELILSLQGFHEASARLSTTLDLDPTVTLAPDATTVVLAELVDGQRPIEELLALAVEYREDLHSIRLLVEASRADVRAARWRSLGPVLGLAGQLGSIRGDADGVSGLGEVDQGPDGQERISAGLGWRLDPAQIGEVSAVEATGDLAGIEARKKLQEVRAQVVREDQESRAQRALAQEARQELAAADEAVRMTRANLRAGTMTTLDVLHAQSELEQARLRSAASVVRHNQAQVRLLAALGLLDERALLSTR